MQFISKGAYPTTQYKSTQHYSYSDVLPPYLYYTSFSLTAAIQSIQFRYEPAVFMPYNFHCIVLWMLGLNISYNAIKYCKAFAFPRVQIRDTVNLRRQSLLLKWSFLFIHKLLVLSYPLHSLLFIEVIALQLVWLIAHVAASMKPAALLLRGL